MNPYSVLGVATLAPDDVVKAAYRRLAQRYHPDRETGNEEKFKEIKAAFELIESGNWTPPAPPEPVYRSSFSEPKSKAKPWTPPTRRPTAGEATPEYRGKGVLPDYPVARRVGSRYEPYEVELLITQEQADYGCNVPFKCEGKLLTHWVQPGSSRYRTLCNFVDDSLVGNIRPGSVYNVWVNLRIQK